jgi:hypothetical protein
VEGKVLLALLELLAPPVPELLVALLVLPDVPVVLPGALAGAAGVPEAPVAAVAGTVVPVDESLPPPHEASRPDARSVNRILFFSNMQDNLSCRV